MDFSTINYFAVLAAALSTFILGGLWYSPLLFGKAWMRANNFTDADLLTFSKARMFGWSFLFALVMSLNLAMFLADPKTNVTWGMAAGGLADRIELSLSKLDIEDVIALAQVGKPYKFWTRGPDFFDCSGLTVAAYAQEGWMAADLLLDDAQVTARLRQALPPHVEWLLRTQRSDGTWDSDVRGDFARTPAIADFLIWYDQRCESRDDVKAAVRKAGAFLMDPKRWEKRGFLDASDTAEIWRALVGRPLAALASGKPVL
jgi:hypothetical protein